MLKELINLNVKLYDVDLRMFDNTQTTTDSNLSAEIKEYYDKNLIRNAKPYLVHNQFGQKKPIPKGKGKVIEFRKYSPLPKATTALTEGVTPSGGSLTVTTVTATVAQYGYYIELSDMLLMTAIDNNLVEAGILLGTQAGQTLDTITRDILNAGTNVQYANGEVSARYLLVGGEASGNHYFTVDAVRRAVRALKAKNAQKINGYFVGIIHPDVAYDLMGDDDWINASEYAGSTQIFQGEIGKIHGVRFVETTEAKIFHANDLSAGARNLTVASVLSKTFTIDEALTADDATALVGRKVIIKGYLYTVASAAAGGAGSATITVTEDVQGSPADGDIIYPGEAGAKGRDVYSTLILGANAYGVTEIEGGGLKNIIKQLGSAGSADPLDQRATTGWKATAVAERLVEDFMVRVETCSTFESGAN